MIRCTQFRCILIGHSDNPPSSGNGGSTTDSHKNEGFLKSAWHRLINQHKSPEPKTTDTPKNDAPKKNDDHRDEPKKASESS